VPDLRSFAEDSQGNLWLTDGRTVVVSSEGHVLARYPLENAALLYSAPDGTIYGGNVINFSPSRRAVHAYYQGWTQRICWHDDRFQEAPVDGQRRLEGISCKSETGVQMLTSADGLASNDARILFEDRSGDIWIGTISGLQRLHRGIFTSFTERDGLIRGARQYDSIFEDKRGAIWLELSNRE